MFVAFCIAKTMHSKLIITELQVGENSTLTLLSLFLSWLVHCTTGVPDQEFETTDHFYKPLGVISQYNILKIFDGSGYFLSSEYASRSKSLADVF